MRAPHIFAEQWAKEDGPHSAATERWLDLFYTVRPAVLTARYNLLSPLYGKGETDIFAFARRQRVGVLIKQALGQGQLIRRYDPDRLPTFSTSDHRCADPAFSPENRQGLDAQLAPLRARFGDSPAELARVALRYALQHAPDAAVLAGFRSTAQIHTNVTCLGDPLLPEEIIEIRALLHPNTPAA